ncbi:MAG: metal-dependent hydrolase [Burkholderiales bacterium]
MLSEEIVVRNPGLKWRDPSSRFWFGNSAIRSNWMNALSTLFPAGERLFVDSVRHYEDRIGDPALRAKVAAFIGQESAHGREHRRFNELLKSHGYPVDRMEALVENLLAHVRRRYGERTQLAVTCALEHFTTILCTEVLRSPEFHTPMQGEHFRLWCWHCLEELEHKTVAFDVYVATGGTYLRRMITTIHASLVLWPILIYIMLRYQAHDRRLFSPSEWWVGLTWGFLWPGLLRRLVPRYLAYFRPGYHPSQNPDAELIPAWRARLGF